MAVRFRASRPTQHVAAKRALSLTLLFAAACAGGGTGEGAGGTPAPTIARDQRNISFDPTPTYRQIGLIAQGAPFPIVGRVAFLASANPDTTHVLLGFSFANAALSFSREGDNRFRATYSVGITFERSGERVRTSDVTETVLVGTFRETGRADESLLYQEVIDLPPGTYTMRLAVRDGGSQRSAQEQREVVVPRLDAGDVSSPVPVNQATLRAHRSALPTLLTSPRATVAFGRDSVLPIYVERYGSADRTVQLLVRDETGAMIWSETAPVEPGDGIASGIVEIPVGRLGIGVAQISLTAPDGADTASTYVFVGFGPDLPVVRFDEMLSFLRYYASLSRIRTLRDAPVAERAAAWATFLRETDLDPGTAENESLRQYFDRLIKANGRFVEEDGPGWLTDRGKVMIVLGEPTQIVEPTTGAFQRGRQQLWEYRERGMQFVFYDQTGTGRWRLTQSSEVRFEQEFRRRVR